jgi:hypothetical protein
VPFCCPEADGKGSEKCYVIMDSSPTKLERLGVASPQDSESGNCTFDNLHCGFYFYLQVKN